MALTLKQAIEKYPSNHTEYPRTSYNEMSDSIAVYLADVVLLSERIDDKLTVHRDRETNELVGCTIKGVSVIAKYAITAFKISENEINLSVFLLSSLPVNESVKEFFYELAEKSIQIPIASQWRSAA